MQRSFAVKAESHSWRSRDRLIASREWRSPDGNSLWKNVEFPNTENAWLLLTLSRDVSVHSDLSVLRKRERM